MYLFSNKMDEIKTENIMYENETEYNDKLIYMDCKELFGHLNLPITEHFFGPSDYFDLKPEPESEPEPEPAPAPPPIPIPISNLQEEWVNFMQGIDEKYIEDSFSNLVELDNLDQSYTNNFDSFSIMNNQSPIIKDCLLSASAEEVNLFPNNNSVTLSSPYGNNFSQPKSNQNQNRHSPNLMRTSRRSVLRNQIRPETPQSQSECEDESKERGWLHASEITGQIVTAKPQLTETGPKRNPWDYLDNDHSYHRIPNRMELLGVQTPSDSEEETVTPRSRGRPKGSGKGKSICKSTEPGPLFYKSESLQGIKTEPEHIKIENVFSLRHTEVMFDSEEKIVSPKPRGRPKGSGKGMSKVMLDSEEKIVSPKPRGRPKGSGKGNVIVIKEEKTVSPKPRGRPKGSGKGKSKVMLDSIDSEEEIDVVSVGGMTPAAAASTSKNANALILRNMGTTSSTLPTNPSLSDQHHLQMKMAKAIGKNHKADMVVSPRYNKAANFREETSKRGSRKEIIEIQCNKKLDSDYMEKPAQRGRSRMRNSYNKTETRVSIKKMDIQENSRKRSVSKSRSRDNSYVKRRKLSQDPNEKRNTHNCLERERRVTLTKLLANLQNTIDCDGKKCTPRNRQSKVVILSRATTEAKTLTLEEQSLEEEKRILTIRHRLLKKAVKYMRTSAFNNKYFLFNNK